jgi:hypothetical protein
MGWSTVARKAVTIPAAPGTIEGVALTWSLFGVIVALLSGPFVPVFGIYRRIDALNAHIDALSADLHLHTH